MCRATALVYSDGVKGVSATGVVLGIGGRMRRCEGHASLIIDGKVFGAFSEDCVLQERCRLFWMTL